MKKTLADKLREIAADQGMGDDPAGRYFEKLLGLSSGRISQIMELGAQTSLGPDSLSQLVKLGYNPEWLSGKSKAKWLKNRKNVDAETMGNTMVGPDIRGPVPLISWVQAGQWQEVIDNLSPGDAEEWLPCPVSHGDRTFVLRVRGESMLNPYGRPSFMDGDLIFVDPDRHAEHGSLVVVRLDDEKGATFKKLVIEGDRKYLRPLNPAWPEPMMQINGNATICGVVIGKWEPT